MKKINSHKIHEEKDTSIIFMRFVATALMFVANFAYFFESTQFSFGIRFLASLAAPIFLFIFGYCAYHLFLTNKFDYRFLLKRLFQFASCAIFLDLFYWEIYPFQNGDILYTYMLSTLLLYFLLRSATVIQFLTLVFFIFTSLFSYKYFSYEFEINYLVLHGYYPSVGFLVNMALNNTFFTGWFPFFVWGIFPIVGFFVARSRSYIVEHAKVRWAIVSFVILSLCVSFNQYLSIKFAQARRKSNIELFYPCDWNSVLLYLCIVYLLLEVFGRFTFNKKYLRLFEIKHGLLIYSIHFFVLKALYQGVGQYLKSEILIAAVAIFAFIMTHFLLIFSVNFSKRDFYKS